MYDIFGDYKVSYHIAGKSFGSGCVVVVENVIDLVRSSTPNPPRKPTVSFQEIIKRLLRILRLADYFL